MRLIPVITAILVTAFLFLLIIERERLMAFAQGDYAALTSSTWSAEAAEAPEQAPEAAQPAATEQASAEPAAPEAEAEDEQTPSIRVVAVRSTARLIDSAVILRGQTEAARQVDVRAETSGQVVSEPLRKGAFVEAGQLLCQLDPGTREASLAEAQARLNEARARVPASQAAVEEAQARLEEARINDNAASTLGARGYASDTRVASAQAGVRAAQAGLASATSGLQSTQAGIESAQAAVAAVEKDIERLAVRAPFAGLLESDTAELGSLLQPGAHCATVIQLDPIKLVGFVPETEVNRVKLGALAGARLAGGNEVRGRVTFLSRSADATTRTFRTEIQVPNADLSIRDGQTAEILIAADGAKAHLLPQSSLTLNDDGDLGVRLVEPGDLSRFYPVDYLRDTAEGVWLAGLPETANVITVGQEYVTDGVKVLPSYRETEE